MTNLNILIVDDEKRIREELSEYLLRHHYSVQCAIDGENGLALLQHGTVDILILDIRLPGMDGLEVLRKALSSYPTLEVIMISGHGDMNTVIQAMRLGAIDYLQKPFRSSEIKRWAGKHLDAGQPGVFAAFLPSLIRLPPLFHRHRWRPG